MKRFIYFGGLSIIGDVLNMYLQCQICGYKYNFFMSDIKAKCIICQSEQVIVGETEPEIEIEQSRAE